MLPYNEKLWAVPLKEMGHSWLEGRVPTPDLGEIVDGALRPQPKPMGPNARFGYPLRGGFGAMIKGWLAHLDPSRLRTGWRLSEIDPIKCIATSADGESIQYRNLIVTAPLSAAVKMVKNAPEAVREAAHGLRHVSVRCVNFAVDRAKVTGKHWIYYPEDTVFHRIFVQSNASKFCAPPGTSSFTAGITYSAYKPLPSEGGRLIDQVIRDARKVGIIGRKDRVIYTRQVDLPFAYVVPDTNRESNVRIIRSWLEQNSVYTAGRFAEWEYYNSDHAMLAGKRVAETIRGLRPIVKDSTVLTVQQSSLQ